MDEQITDAKETNNEKIRSLRVAIDAKLHEQGIYEQIRDLVNSKIKVTSPDEDVDTEQQPNTEKDPVDEEATQSSEEQLIHDVLESEVVQQLLATVRSMELATPAKSTNHEEADDEALENDRDAFVDQLVELEQDTKNADQDDNRGGASYAVDVMAPWEALCLVEEPEAIQRNASNHSFYKYAKQWWDEFRSETRQDKRQPVKGPKGDDEYSQLLAQLGSRQRLVKMFAEDEEGRYRMICKFITPLRAPMAVRSPSEAARFVGLLPYESNALLGGGADETWRSIATVLSVRKGDAQDHAILLASLLLGCGLDAFVCIGTISASKSASRFARGSQRSYEDRGSTEVAMFGSSHEEAGEKFAVNDSRAPRRRGYCAIDCVFNHRQFFANLQPRAWKLAESSFDFEDETCWKRMDENLIADLPFGQPQTALLPPDVSSASLLEQEWVATLRRAIASRRRAEGLVTRWSEELSFYLLPALNSYELERLYGVTQVDNLFFQQSVTNFVEEGHTFQGVPSMFSIESPDEALTAMASNPLVADILTLHARSAQFALAVRCFPYAEHTVPFGLCSQ
ncbi:hypothetical protein PInf_026069 [Phytophthora infestans]|nr:hypothetical protein PInf_026069 [Phytophthora infestans]